MVFNPQHKYKFGGKVGSHDGHPLDTANYQDFGVALGGIYTFRFPWDDVYF